MNVVSQKASLVSTGDRQQRRSHLMVLLGAVVGVPWKSLLLWHWPLLILSYASESLWGPLETLSHADSDMIKSSQFSSVPFMLAMHFKNVGNPRK